MNIIMNTYHEEPIQKLEKPITIGMVQVNGKWREYYIDHGVMNGKGEVFTYALWYREGDASSNACRDYRNLITAVADATEYINTL